MSQIVTLELPDRITHQALAIAKQTQRRLEEVLVAWLDHAAAEPPMESLPDDEIMALCDLQLSPSQQPELDNLLALKAEGQLNEVGKYQLEKLMQIYRRGLLRKAEALKVAVYRGLRPPLSYDS